MLQTEECVKSQIHQSIFCTKIPTGNQNAQKNIWDREWRKEHNEKSHSLAFLHRTEWDGMNHNITTFMSSTLLV
jgi:hypothetical protein